MSVLEAKLKDKTNQLEKLEKIQLNLEAKIPTKETLEAYSNEKVTDLMAELEKVKEDNRILKVPKYFFTNFSTFIEIVLLIFRLMCDCLSENIKKWKED